LRQIIRANRPYSFKCCDQFISIADLFLQGSTFTFFEQFSAISVCSTEDDSGSSMYMNCNVKIDRLAGAETISIRAREIGLEAGVVIIECLWDIGEDVDSAYAHRLDLSAATKTVRLYFPDLELTTSNNDGRKKRTENRLRNAIAQLTCVTPSATYTYS
jgi:hypothetical protein